MIEQHLQSLLYQKECVVIPGFGALITNYQPARINENSHRIDPPSKTPAFNESLQTNDGVLADQIARHEGMNYPQALEAIRQEVKQWHAQLRSKQSLKLEGIGCFQKDENGKLVFKPSKDKNYLKEAYGFNSVALRPVQQMESVSQDQPVIKPITSIPKRRTPVASMIAAAGIVFAIFMISLVMYHNPGPSTAHGDLNPVTSQSKDSTIPGPNHQVNKASPKPQKDTTGQPESISREASTKANTEFVVITGSFQKPENARSYKAKWKSKGYNAQILENKKGWHRVGVASYKDSVQAVNTLQQVKDSDAPSAWVLKMDDHNQN